MNNLDTQFFKFLANFDTINLSNSGLNLGQKYSILSCKASKRSPYWFLGKGCCHSWRNTNRRLKDCKCLGHKPHTMEMAFCLVFAGICGLLCRKWSSSAFIVEVLPLLWKHLQFISLRARTRAQYIGSAYCRIWHFWSILC